MSLVVDNSVLVACCIPDEQTPELLSFLSSIYTTRILVPSIWPAEFANITQNARRRGRLDDAGLLDARRLVATLDIQVRNGWNKETIGRAQQLMTEFALTAYDASYLALAMDERLPLATFDKDLRSAALLAHVPLAI